MQLYCKSWCPNFFLVFLSVSLVVFGAAGCSSQAGGGQVYCLIDGVAYAPGEANPANRCEKCNPSLSEVVWTPVANPDDCVALDPSDTGPDSDAAPADLGDVTDPDMTPDDTGAADVDTGSPVDMDAGADADVSVSPGELTCPADLKDSCIYQALTCFGLDGDINACVHDTILMQDEAQFQSGSQAFYRTFRQAGQNYSQFDTLSSEGDLCYRATGLDSGDDPERWSVQEHQGFIYAVEFREGPSGTDEVVVTCPSGEEEICSRMKFDSYFAFPDAPPANCPDRQLMDQCDFDTDCPVIGELCCQVQSGGIKQCLNDEFCLLQRPPVTCDIDSECGPGEICSRCGRSNVRECMPSSVVNDPMNQLGCAPDGCAPGGGTCLAPRECCKVGDVYTCSVPTECDQPPVRNPVCHPGDQMPCSNATYQCCFVRQLNEFRCLESVTFCDDNVCFGNADCSSTEECCGYNPTAGIAGSCRSMCMAPDPTCTQDSDCTLSQGSFCCKYPGYNVGLCVAFAQDCNIRSCMASTDCLGGEECCGLAPLTTSVCVNIGDCPPLP